MATTLLFLALSLALQAQTAPEPGEVDTLEQAAAELREQAQARAEEAEAAQIAIARLQQRLVEAAGRVETREAEVEAATERLRALEREEADLLARLRAERADLARVLAALQRIEMSDPPALAVTPDDAASAARAAGLLAQIAPQLEARVLAVRERLAELEALRLLLQDQTRALIQAREALGVTREEVTALIEERRAAEAALRAQADDLSQRAARIAEQAGSLRELLADIRRFAAADPRLAPRPEPRPEPAPGIPVPRLRPEQTPALAMASLVDARPVSGPLETLRFSDTRGRLSPPVRGELTVSAGDRGPDGVRREGVWFETAQRAQVTALFDGVVVYAGPFQGFDGVLMINTPDGYTLILGGLGLIYAVEGQSLLAGEPVGAMSDRANPPPMLYLEIRRSTDEAADPEDWLRPEFRRG
ncbi:murein hydrolase activator EnvC family protein [Oceanicaulis alexandrii]|uniref:murein hydrolase activator EnvC family protein n=1 Tax=Oceanicaulis alexandrii TaxID=153233 RepID=UPI0023548A46|nr:peptidoglycan DD-metalloendopeptidase family protein [Oceanicaulis alexandrii]